VVPNDKKLRDSRKSLLAGQEGLTTYKLTQLSDKIGYLVPTPRLWSVSHEGSIILVPVVGTGDDAEAQQVKICRL
jgi:hypothetical protein